VFEIHHEEKKKRAPFRGEFRITRCPMQKGKDVRRVKAVLKDALENEIFKIWGSLRNGRFLWLSYRGHDKGANRFGSILLQKTKAGKGLKGFILGYSTLFDELGQTPAIGAGSLDLEFIQNESGDGGK
jgi:hypothetical protein